MRAQCLCGDIVWEVDGPLQLVHDCHCSRCQKSHGVGYLTSGAVSIDRFRWVKGRESARAHATSADAQRLFCGRCGSSLPDGHDLNGTVFVPIGPLEGEVEAKSDGHIFVSTRMPWVAEDGLPAFDGFPPGFDAAPLDDLGRDAGDAGRCPGSCLCGAVTWEIDTPPERMRYCHCLRCRRARTAAHAANAFVLPEKFRWTGGQERVELYELPEAERFSQAFCRDCGGPVPWLIRARGYWNVPLGSLDGDPGGGPTEHIFVGSKAPWDEIRDGVRQFEEYPED